jgi:polysaccharide chain length determinant protein (PEP-CTERM system associated)
MTPKDGMNLQYLKGAFVRRFWYIALPFFVVSLAVVGYCIKAPRLFKAQTLVLVEPQKVPNDYVKSTVSTEVSDRLLTIEEQVKSRTRLEKIIRNHDLYPDIRAARTMTDAVEVCGKNIEIKARRPSESDRSASFEIAFTNTDPVKARNVTNAIANLFIEDNLKMRETQATGTTIFLDREVKRMKEVLRQKEEQVRQFKEKYSGLMPEQMENNVGILTQLQRQLDSLNVTIQQTEDRKVLMQTQLNRLETVRAGTGRAVGQDGELAPDRAPLTLDELRQQVQSLKLRYSDKHPDVISLAGRVAKLEKEQEATGPDTDTQKTSIQPPASEAQRIMLVQREDFLSQLKLIDKELVTLAKEKKKIGRQIARYQQRIENGPKIEQMFVDLGRGYREASGSYQSLLEKKMQAELAENMERTQQAEQLRILDYARLPEKPIKPDVRKILALGFMMALACGLGLAYVREYLDPTFWRSKDLESVVQLPVLVSVPVVNTKPEGHWNLLKKAAAAGALVSMASVLIYTLFHLWKMETMVFLG